ncbi:MAG TPA: sigma-70 family RNA polymerase sigma factor, partial [Methylomirabilota bacterium]|nr:sigma-70 family RNA polymerase sigma factor [Methylomirabilota bacterium]
MHLDLLYRAALRLTHNRAEAEDLVQETWLRALRHFDQFDPGSNCRAWLLTILRNAFLNRVRREGREILESDMAATEAGAARIEEASVARSSPEEDFFQTVLHGDVDRALKTLPLPFRLVVTLADLEGLTYKEVAQVLDCPIGTVMSRLS